ncbi:transposase [Nocardia sp. NPDC057440]|uniref:transposase n=1 Tax=Nocardia sp. NPDC057440 TaxID=3346134 RepID=UPI003671378E
MASGFSTARAVVKHAGLAPREKLSGAFTGRTKLTGQGRPALRLAAGTSCASSASMSGSPSQRPNFG